MSDFHGPQESKELYDRLEKEKRFSINTDDLSGEELHAVKAKMAAFDNIFGQGLKAKFKVEVQFGKSRSTWKPFPGALSVFLSGTKFHGGGDGKLYLCPAPHCGGLIYPHERIGAKLLCRKCDKFWVDEDVVGEMFYFLAPPKWAAVIHRMFVQLDHNADLYLKYHPTDIRHQTSMEMARARGGDEIGKARRNRGMHIYPLKNIVKDTSGGAQLYDRILAFIKA